MRYRPRFEQLESRDTPSAFSPASPVVSFFPPTAPGVPFSQITVPVNTAGFASSPGPFADVTGFFASGAADTNAGVFGAPAVVLQPS